ALVNTRGELVGINTLIYSETGSYAGYSFAIPSSIVLKIVEDLKTYGSVQRAVLGLSYTELTADLAKEKNITAVTEGLYVANVLDRSSAKEAGLQEGDVIVKINGKDVKNSGLLKEVMGKLRPGDKADITYYRNNKMHSVSVVLKNNQGNTEITKLTGMTTALGCSFNEVSDETKQQLQISNGVEVVGLKAGKLQRAGMKEGFIITEINGQSVNSREDVEEIYNDLLKSQTSRKIMTIIGLYPTGAEDYFAINIAK
ncbi:MAG: PDZ domain-containing protein, partial [Muribaculaceae bacterium]|nr:PDZ domain-containing protein [Muribaculaceae bacterium]